MQRNEEREIKRRNATPVSVSGCTGVWDPRFLRSSSFWKRTRNSSSGSLREFSRVVAPLAVLCPAAFTVLARCVRRLSPEMNTSLSCLAASRTSSTDRAERTDDRRKPPEARRWSVPPPAAAPLEATEEQGRPVTGSTEAWLILVLLLPPMVEEAPSVPTRVAPDERACAPLALRRTAAVIGPPPPLSSSEASPSPARTGRISETEQSIVTLPPTFVNLHAVKWEDGRRKGTRGEGRQARHSIEKNAPRRSNATLPA